MDTKEDVSWNELNKKQFISLGITTSAISSLLFHPFKFAKTCIQVLPTTPSQRTDEFLKKIYRTDGFRGLFRASVVSSLGNIITDLSYYVTYEKSKALLTDTAVHRSHTMNPEMNARISAVSGCVADILCTTVSTPFDIISQRRMSQRVLLDSISKNSFHECKLIYSTKGLKGFYKGYSAALIKNLPESFAWWYFYAHCKHWSTQYHLPAPIFVSGMGASISSVLLLHPLDIVKTRLQTLDTSKGVVKEFKEIWKQEGVRGFTRGLGARLLHSSLIMGSTMSIYEQIKLWSPKHP